LIDHLVEAGRRAAALGHGQAPPPGDSPPRVALADAPGELRAAAQEAAQAWADDAGLTAMTTMPWGAEYAGTTLVDMYVAELAAHAWDLAVATGQVDLLDRSLALPALEGAQAWIEPEYRNMVGPGSPFGSEVELAPDASEWDRFVAFMGRDPRISFRRQDT
jgi:uncharacterized protein (TIGR03086 family)